MKALIILLMCLIHTFISSAQQVYKVDITKAIYKAIPMKNVLDDIKVVNIKLPDSLKLQIVIVTLTHDGNHLIAYTLNEDPYMFDLEGRFVKIIKPSSSTPHSQGLGTKFLNAHYDINRNIFYEDYFDYWIGIDVETNKIVKRVIKPQLFKKRLASFIQISENEYIGYSSDVVTGENSNLLFFDSCGHVLKHEPDLEPFTYGSKYPRGPFGENGDKYYFVDPYLGTKIYEIEKLKLIPHIKFNTNNDKLSYAIETRERIYFCFMTSEQGYWGYYSKEEDQAYIASNSKNTFESSIFDENKFFPSFINGCNSVMSSLEGDSLKVIIGTFK